MQNLLSYLVVMLSRANVELLVLVTTFLRKLSIYEENKQRMEEAGLIQRLAVLVPMGEAGWRMEGTGLHAVEQGGSLRRG